MTEFAAILQRLMGLAAAIISVFLVGPARAEIQVSPLRQVLTPDHRAARYRITNPSDRIIEGHVRWLDLIATETGYDPALPDEREALSAAPFLQVRPARFRLEPGASTTVTVTLRSDLPAPPGERRSHLVFDVAAVRTPLRKAGGGMALDIGLGVSTPVILRSGAGAAKAAFGQTRLLRTADGLLELETHLRPKGAFSAYGGLEVWFSPETQSSPKKTLLARVENVAVYGDSRRRRIIAPLNLATLSAGVMELRFEGRAEFAGRTFAKRTFEVAPPK